MTAEYIVPLSEYHRLPQEAQTADYYKRLLEVVCNNATLALFIMDEYQQCVYMNPAAETLTGYSLSETKGRALHDVIHHTRPDGRPYPLCECPIDQAFPTNNQEQGEEVFVHKDGNFYPVAYTASPIREGDRVTGTIIEVRDITQEILAQQARQEALRREQKLRTEIEAAHRQISHLLESMSDAFIALDGDWKIIYMNAEAERLNQKPRTETLGKTHWEEWSASIGTNVEYQYRRVMQQRVPVHFEHHYYFPPNYDLWLEINAYPTEEGVGIFYRDITKRKQAEAKLRQSEERYRYLAESIPQKVWTATPDGALIDVNQRWLEFTGLTLAQAQSGGWALVVHPDDLPILKQHWLAAQQGSGSHYQAEGRMRRADGVYRWHLHQAIPLRNEQGQIIKWFGSATDVEDKKQLEQQHQRLLQQEQAARAAAEQVNRIKDEFLAVLSHELRSPLNPILGWSRLLQTGKLDAAKTKQALETIERNAKLQSELIEDLLDVSRILRGKFSLRVGAVDLSIIIGAAIETVRLAAEAKSIQIKTMLNSNIGKVMGDSSRLQQVVWNLLSNAIKFTPQGGEVKIQLERSGSFAQITISDTGKGISPEFLPYVFEYFRQENATTTRKFGGLGLGLAIVHHLVELHGGTVQADSLGEDKGATFTVNLPIAPNPTQTNQGMQQPQQSYDLSGIKILIVDDDADSCEFLAFLLEQAGAKVKTTNSALAALTTLPQYHPDLLLSDIGMPEMDGYQLMQQVRALAPDQGGKVRAIALTAYAGEIDYQQAMAVGFQQHIAKPVDAETLLREIASLIK